MIIPGVVVVVVVEILFFHCCCDHIIGGAVILSLLSFIFVVGIVVVIVKLRDCFVLPVYLWPHFGIVYHYYGFLLNWRSCFLPTELTEPAGDKLEIQEKPVSNKVQKVFSNHRRIEYRPA